MKNAQDYLKETASGHARGGFNSRLQDVSWSDCMYGARGYVWAERNAGWELADGMIKSGKIFSEIKTKKGKVEFKCYPDGTAWCCIAPEFENLQESDCFAFGDTREEAIKLFLDSKIVNTAPFNNKE